MERKNHRAISFLIVLVFIFIQTGCEREVSWPIENVANDFIVVEGIITNEFKQQTIKLTRTISAPNETPEPVTGAEVIVSTIDSVYTFSEDSTKPGVYNSNVPFAGIVSNEYTLFINATGNIITAKAIMPQGADFQFLRYNRQAGKGMLYNIVWVAGQYNAESPAMYEILLDWSIVPGYEGASYDSTHARLLHYTLPTLDVSQMFAPAMETVLFPKGTIITEKRYSLSTQHAAFIRALLAETNFQGGLFNSVPSNLPVNLSNNGIGFFGASAVTIKTRVAGNAQNGNSNEGF
jgi:hypothetical protein